MVASRATVPTGARRGAMGAVALAAWALLTAEPAAPQTLRGQIVDSESGSPIALAYVGLLQEGRDMVAAALAGSSGDFSLRAPRPGAYFVYVARAGYETLMDGVFELGPDGVFDVRIGLKPEPVELPALEVETRRSVSPLEAVGFYDRAAVGHGHFILRAEIERVAVDRITDAFRGIPALTLRTGRPLTGTPDVLAAPAVVIRRGGEQCAPTLYVDRAMVASGTSGPVRPDDFVTPRDVEAIEVYARSSEVPVEFRALSNCGVVLIWTRMR